MGVEWLPLTALPEAPSGGCFSGWLPLNRLNTWLACSFSSVAATSMGLLEDSSDGEDWSALYCAYAAGPFEDSAGVLPEVGVSWILPPARDLFSCIHDSISVAKRSANFLGETLAACLPLHFVRTLSPI